MQQEDAAAAAKQQTNTHTHTHNKHTHTHNRQTHSTLAAVCSRPVFTASVVVTQRLGNRLERGSAFN